MYKKYYNMKLTSHCQVDEERITNEKWIETMNWCFTSYKK